MDAVADRDFAAEFLFVAALSGVHLSRLGEEVVLWTSQEFGWVELDDAFATGSSIMPQKKNADIAELARGKAGRLIGGLVAVLTMLKGLPLTYDRDMQEDKEPAFDAFDNLSLAIAAMTGMVKDLEPNREAMRRAAAEGHSTATDLADWLVRRLGLAFREAHHVTGRLLALAEKKGCDLAGLDLADMREINGGITEEVFGVLTVEASLASRKSVGGTAPGNVRREARRWLKALAGASRPARRATKRGERGSE
jgi:argininosuccinate lyase